MPASFLHFPPRLSIYHFVLPFVVLWWVVAFFPSEKNQTHLVVFTAADSLTLHPSDLLNELSILKREELCLALSGDTGQITSFAKSWKKDKEKLKQLGYCLMPNSAEDKILAFVDILETEDEALVSKLNQTLSLNIPFENDSSLISSPSNQKARFFPQTYAAATFLLALLPQEQIVSLPIGMKQLSYLFPSLKKGNIPFSSTGYSSEKLYLDAPKVAFLAPYSHFSFKELLERHRIPICCFNHDNSIDMIQSTLRQIGKIIANPIKAELLALFMEAGLEAIDNRIALLEESFKPEKKKNILFLNFRNSFSLPGKKSLSSILLERQLKKSSKFVSLESKEEWSSPVGIEKILAADPDSLILFLPFDDLLLKKRAECHLSQLSFKKEPKFICIDENIQNSPTHYALLAYFDLFQALRSAFL